MKNVVYFTNRVWLDINLILNCMSRTYGWTNGGASYRNLKNRAGLMVKLVVQHGEKGKWN